MRDTINRATQDESTTRLGPPHAARALTNGEMAWQDQRYQGDLLCLTYILRFDPADILRQWTRQGCQAAEPQRLSFFSRDLSVVGLRDAQPPAGCTST